jgi:hypothetical protein
MHAAQNGVQWPVFCEIVNEVSGYVKGGESFLPDEQLLNSQKGLLSKKLLK